MAVNAARQKRSRILAEEPDAAVIWVQYGHVLKETGDAAGVEVAYREALRHDCETADTWLQLGHTLKIKGRIEEAVAAYWHALTLDPELVNAARELTAIGGVRRETDPAPTGEPVAVNGNSGSG
jgi:cytochrome c-type biogenesis protein CcmH/NrfG